MATRQRRVSAEHKIPGAEIPSLLESEGMRLAGLALLSFIVYLPALFAEFNWDDDALIRNPLIREARGLMDIWFHPSRMRDFEEHYWPVTYTSFWLEYRIWGMHAAGFLFTNVVLHSINSLLLYFIVTRFSSRGAWLAAALFAVHPAHVEAVGWAIARKDLLSAFFYFSAFLAYLKFTETRGLKFGVAAMALYALAMLSKSIALTLPVALAIVISTQDRRREYKRLSLLVPMLILGIVIAYLDWRWGKQVVRNPGTELDGMERLALAGRNLGFYFSKVVWPFNFMAIYPRVMPSAIELGRWVAYAVAFIPLALFASGGSRSVRWMLASWAIFAITLAPVLGFVDFGFMLAAFGADRYQYLASAALIAPFAIACVAMGRRLDSKSIRLKKMAAVFLLIVLGALTFSETMKRRNQTSLFTANLARNPGSWLVHEALGAALARSNNLKEAIAHYKKAHELEPRSVRIMSVLARMLVNANQPDEAAEIYRQWLAIQPDQPEARAELQKLINPSP